MFLIIICHEVWMDGIFTPDFWRGDWGEGWMLRGSGFDDVIVFSSKESDANVAFIMLL